MIAIRPSSDLFGLIDATSNDGPGAACAAGVCARSRGSFSGLNAIVAPRVATTAVSTTILRISSSIRSLDTVRGLLGCLVLPLESSQRLLRFLHVLESEPAGIDQVRDDRLNASAEKTQEIVDQPSLRRTARHQGVEDVRVPDFF